MVTLVEGALQRAVAELDHARSRLRLLTPAAQIEQGYLRLDDMANRLNAALRHAAQDRRRQLAEMRGAFERNSPERRIQQESHNLLSLWKRLQAASPRSVLNRGFVIVRDAEGRPVTRRATLASGQSITTEFAVNASASAGSSTSGSGTRPSTTRRP